MAGFKISLSYAIVILTVLEYMQMGNETGLGTLVYNEMEQLIYKRAFNNNHCWFYWLYFKSTN
jgi:ABC-type nitrate/sulfonate/bicarbonate transport system permease component